MSAVNFDLKTYAPDAAADRMTAPPTQAMTRHEQPRVAVNFASAETARVRWYEAAIAAYEQRERQFGHAREEEEMLLLRQPLASEQAYARFGLLLGALVPAAIFARFILAFSHQLDAGSLVVISFCLTMNLVCALVGWRTGRRAGQRMRAVERASWSRLSLKSMLEGLLWGAITGGAGGAVCFGIGALYGAVCAITVAIPAFVLFALLRP